MTGDWISPGNGKTLPPADVVAEAAKASVVLLGEQHDRLDHHLWQLHVAQGIHGLRKDIVMGFEMFPARLDCVLNAWVAGELEEAAFLEKVEWGQVWGFDSDLYMPLFRFCRDNQVPMIGLNCRRGLVREVGRDGWDNVPADNREGLSRAVAATEAYRQYLYEVTGGHREDRKARSAADPVFDSFVRAQQTWDRAFACRIADAVQKPESPLVIGIIGRGHLEFRHGTPFQLADLGVPDTVVLLPTDEQDHVRENIADAVYRLSASGYEYADGHGFQSQRVDVQRP